MLDKNEKGTHISSDDVYRGPFKQCGSLRKVWKDHVLAELAFDVMVRTS